MLRRAESTATEIGCWHSHPEGGGRPSVEGDLSTWLNARDFLDVSSYLGLIVAPSRSGGFDGWSIPDIFAWQVRRDGAFNRAVCEPVEVRWT
jgi:hypothetical protein